MCSLAHKSDVIEPYLDALDEIFALIAECEKGALCGRVVRRPYLSWRFQAPELNHAVYSGTGWSQVVELLKAAPDDLRLSQRLAERCSSLTGQKFSGDPTAKARVLWLGLSRGLHCSSSRLNGSSLSLVASSSPISWMVCGARFGVM